MRLAVSEQGYSSAVESLVSGNGLAAQGATVLADRLRGYGGMAGDDSTATEFAASYDEAAAASVEALESMVGAFGMLGRMVEASLSNHAHADALSTLPGWARAVVGPRTVADRAVGVLLAPPPSSLGAESDGPSGVPGMVLDVLQDVFWPNADTDRVRAAAGAWSTAARSVGLLEAHCTSALAALEGERSPEIPIALAVIRDVRSQAGDLAAQLESLGTACSDYAAHVDAKRSELLSLLEDLAKELAIGAIFAGGLSILSGGAAAGLAGSAGAARLASAGSKARGILDSLRVLAGGSALGMRPVAVTAGEASGAFGRISRARVMLMEASGPAARSSSPRSSTFLKAEDAAGGHVRAKHVGKSDEQLLKRLVDEPDIPFSSSFTDEMSAEHFIKDVLSRRSDEVDSWLAGGRGRLRLEEWGDSAIGRSAGRDGAVTEVSGIRVILEHAPHRPTGFRVVTSFPQP